MGSVSISYGVSAHLGRLQQMYNAFESSSDSDMLRFSTLDGRILLLPQSFILVCPLMYDILKTHSVKEKISIIVPDSSCSSVQSLYQLISHGYTTQLETHSDEQNNIKTARQNIDEIVEASKQFGFNLSYQDILFNMAGKQDSERLLVQENEYREIPTWRKPNDDYRCGDIDNNIKLADLQIKLEFEDSEEMMEKNLKYDNSKLPPNNSCSIPSVSVMGNSRCPDEVQDLRQEEMSSTWNYNCSVTLRNILSSERLDSSTPEHHDEDVSNLRPRRLFEGVSYKSSPFKPVRPTKDDCENVYIGSLITSSKVTSKGRKVQQPSWFYDCLFPYD